MNDLDRKGYRALFDDTMKTIKKGEAYEAALTATLRKTKMPRPSLEKLLASATKNLDKLRGEAKKLEKLGWGGNRGRL
jgi:hypothetical protein